MSTLSATRIATMTTPTAMLDYDFMRTAFVASGRVFVLAGGVEVESGAHRHEDHEHEEGHDHDHAHEGGAHA